MIQHISHKELLDKKQKLREISRALKERFLGLDAIIDEVIALMMPWYLFPESQLRPTVINLWGLTGSGKSALVKELVNLLDHRNLFTCFDAGEFESDSATWIKKTLTDDLEYFSGKSALICLDEFQFARTLNSHGEELGKDKLRVIWELLDSGKIDYVPRYMTYYLFRADDCIKRLEKVMKRDVELKDGIVTGNATLFLEVFDGYYFDDSDMATKTMKIDYFISKDFVDGVHGLFDTVEWSRDKIVERIRACSLQSLMMFLAEGMQSRPATKMLDLSGALIFVLGNLDEAYNMSHNLNPDISADEFHEETSKITLAHIKKALRKRFRPEQIARLGNNHIIYRSFSQAQFRLLIKRELSRISIFVKERFGWELVGAGISFNSNIPTVLPLTQHILSCLDISDELVEIYLRRGFPFEGLVESLKFYLKDIDPLLETFNVQTPTSNHFFIAELIKAGIAGSVYTTNFDLNIELACHELGLVEGNDFKVFYDPSKFKDVQFSEPICKIFKLHGSIQSKSDLGVTLENIANKRYPFVLEPIMDYLFNNGQHKDILFMGYSFSDKFDIQPLMTKLKTTSKYVTVIEHSTQELPDSGIVEPPFQSSPGAKRIYVNTNKFVDEIGIRIFQKKFSDKVSTIDSSIWKRQVDDWLAATLTGKGLQNSISIAASLFSSIEEWHIAGRFVNKGLVLLDDTSKSLDYRFACDMLARRAGVINPENASEEDLKLFCACYERAIPYARLDQSIDNEMTYLGNLAAGYTYLYLLFKERGDNLKADGYKKQATELAPYVLSYYAANGKFIDGGVEKYFGYKMNFALLNRKLDEVDLAKKLYEEVLSETREMHGTGMAEIQSKTYFNLGYIFELKGEVDDAIGHYKQSLSIARDMGFKDRFYYAFQYARRLIEKTSGEVAAKIFFDAHQNDLRKFDFEFE